MSDRSTVLLEHHLMELKLPTFLREYGKVASQCAAEGVDHPGYLLRLSELELIDRHPRMVERRIKAARFPATKSLDTFDFLAMPSVNKHLVMQLARCEYVDRRENVIAVGNSGTGKTHVALGLGLAACQRGLSVGFTTAASLVHELIEARDERRLLNLQKKLARLKLLIVSRPTSVAVRLLPIDQFSRSVSSDAHDAYRSATSLPWYRTTTADTRDGPTKARSTAACSLTASTSRGRGSSGSKSPMGQGTVFLSGRLVSTGTGWKKMPSWSSG